MSIYLSRSFPRSNSSFFLLRGNALQSSVLRLGEEMFLVDAGLGTPRICMQDEPTGVPKNRRKNRATRFENKVGSPDVVAGEKLIKKRILERFFIDVVAGKSLIKERAAVRFNARLNDKVGSLDVVAGEPLFLFPRKFRQKQVWKKLNKIWRRNRKVKGFILRKKRGGFLVAIAGYIAFLPFRRFKKRIKKNKKKFIYFRRFKKRIKKIYQLFMIEKIIPKGRGSIIPKRRGFVVF
uniref:Ribosomal protein S1 n=1 Tax=Corchorus capsularis TaxID=210143 RepID=A0A1C9I9Q1_COCAP|nr:ribosomal protein S1 [Corchorus capsularis]AOO95932.1 ribosomal protein S1 [Corchorus capsularis]